MPTQQMPYTFKVYHSEFEFYVSDTRAGHVSYYDGQWIGFVFTFDNGEPDMFQPVVADTEKGAMNECLRLFAEWIRSLPKNFS